MLFSHSKEVPEDFIHAFNYQWFNFFSYLNCTFYFQDEEELFEAEAEKRDVQQEYKEILVWLNDVEEKASLMAQQWSEDVEEDEPRKKRKAVRLSSIYYAERRLDAESRTTAWTRFSQY